MKQPRSNPGMLLCPVVARAERRPEEGGPSCAHPWRPAGRAAAASCCGQSGLAEQVRLPRCFSLTLRLMLMMTKMMIILIMVIIISMIIIMVIR